MTTLVEHKAISSIMAKLEMAKNSHLQMGGLFFLYDFFDILIPSLAGLNCDKSQERNIVLWQTTKAFPYQM